MTKYLSLLLILLIVIAFTAMRSDVAAPQNEWSNLKVLPNDISKHDLDSAMKMYSVSLGVKCNFCHAMDPDTSTGHHLDFASDAKQEKGAARYMIGMTNYLNQNYFNPDKAAKPVAQILCYTCHRGNKEARAEVLQPQMDSLMKVLFKR
jgi:hypothetical protein